PALDHIIQRCLAKNPAQRWHSARDLWLELESVRDAGSPLAAPVAAKAQNKRVWIVGAVMAGLLIVALIPAVFYFRPPAPAAPAMRFEIRAAGLALGRLMSISPDGQRLAYVGFAGNRSDPTPAQGTIWIRSLNSLDAQKLPGTDGAIFPDWSPDGRFIVFS